MFWASFQTQKWPIWGPKSQKRLQIWQKLKVKIKGNIENKSFSTTWIDLKTTFVKMNAILVHKSQHLVKQALLTQNNCPDISCTQENYFVVF